MAGFPARQVPDHRNDLGQDAVTRIRFAASGDTFGRGRRWQTCIHLSGDGQVLAVDCGAYQPGGAQGGMIVDL